MKKALALLGTLGRVLLTRKPRTRAALEDWQDRRVARVVALAKAKSPFYRAHLRGHATRDWRHFPVIDKAVMMRHFDTFNTRGISLRAAWDVAEKAEATRNFAPTLDGITVGMSSGTSGNRGMFLLSPKECLMWAGYILARLARQGRVGKRRIALFLRADSNLYSPRVGNMVTVRFFDPIVPMSDHLAELAKLDPGVLVGPPSILRLVAMAQAQGQIRLRPQRIVAVAEVLDAIDKHCIGSAFGQTVHQYYQCTEGFLGMTCALGTLHLNEDLVAVQREYLDPERTRFVPIITDLHRTTQPIIRYRLDDVLVLRPDPCECGSLFTALDRVEGRCGDILAWPGRQPGERVPVFADVLSRSLLRASEHIEDYDIEQTGPSSLRIGLRVAKGGAGHEVRHQVGRALEALAGTLRCRVPDVTFVDDATYAPGPKRRKIRNNWREDAPCAP